MIRKLSYNNKILSDEERTTICKMIDETVNEYSKSIDCMHSLLKDIMQSSNEDYKKIMQTQINVGIFVCYAFADCMTLTKLFINATNLYEKRLIRGKLKVLLNESFKQIYGFNKNANKKSYCTKIQEIIPVFPHYTDEFNSIVSDLEEISKLDSWWKEIRDAEVHIDIDKLYESRHEDINESKIVMETMRLLDFFNSFNGLMAKMNQSYISYMK